MAVWYADLSHLHTKWRPTRSDIYQMMYWYNWFSWWWALVCSKHVEKRNKHIKKVRQVVVNNTSYYLYFPANLLPFFQRSGHHRDIVWESNTCLPVLFLHPFIYVLPYPFLFPVSFDSFPRFPFCICTSTVFIFLLSCYFYSFLSLERTCSFFFTEKISRLHRLSVIRCTVYSGSVM